jgi:hypothetical protein
MRPGAEIGVVRWRPGKNVMLARMEGGLRKWLERRRVDQIVKQYGGAQSCPWCRGLIQTGDDWGFSASGAEPQFDVATCGNCSGTSLWLWGLGFHFIRPLQPPKPAAWPPALVFYRAPEPSGNSSEGSDHG